MDPHAFQTEAAARIDRLLAAHGIPHGGFRTGGGVPPVIFTTFGRPDGSYEIVISNNIVMTHGRQLYECFLPLEVRSDEALLDAFLQRLDRFLTGRGWD